MTVAELITRLRLMPSEYRVVVDAHLSGYNDVGLPLRIGITPQSSDRDPSSIGSYVEDFEGEDAVLIAAASPP